MGEKNLYVIKILNNIGKPIYYLNIDNKNEFNIIKQVSEAKVYESAKEANDCIIKFTTKYPLSLDHSIFQIVKVELAFTIVESNDN